MEREQSVEKRLLVDRARSLIERVRPTTEVIVIDAIQLFGDIDQNKQYNQYINHLVKMSDGSGRIYGVFEVLGLDKYGNPYVFQSVGLNPQIGETLRVSKSSRAQV